MKSFQLFFENVVGELKFGFFIGEFLSRLLLEIAFFDGRVAFAGVQNVQSSTKDSSQIFLLHSGLTLGTFSRGAKPFLDATKRSGLRQMEREGEETYALPKRCPQSVATSRC